MKAILLGGGQGTRLREISGNLPKPMMPLLGIPLLEHTVRHLKSCGFSDLCITLCYAPEVIRRHFGSGSRFGVRIEYRQEKTPLGTAGAVRNCRDFINGSDVLVMSGDCACDFALDRLMENHAGGVTIALTTHGEPLPYGLVLTDRKGHITEFLEKPEWNRVVTDQISTGIYVLSPDIVDRIPTEGACDFGKDLFPQLLREGVPMHGVVMDGYWCDIGTPRAYYQCNLDALDGKLRLTDRSGKIRKIIPCRDRARLMGAVCRHMAEFGADFSDGLTVNGKGGRAHLAPLPDRCALLLEGEGDAVRTLEKLTQRLAAEDDSSAKS